MFVFAILAPTLAQEFYIQDDGVPILFGAGNDRSMARTSSLVISPSPSPRQLPPRSVAPIQQSFSFVSRPAAPIQQRPAAPIQQQSFSAPQQIFSLPVATSKPTPHLCDHFSRPLVRTFF